MDRVLLTLLAYEGCDCVVDTATCGYEGVNLRQRDVLLLRTYVLVTSVTLLDMHCAARTCCL